jgi:uncharacterized heparinase superfamily protein
MSMAIGLGFKRSWRENYRRADLLFATLRYLTLSQIWHRGHRLIQRRWWRAIGKKAPRPEQAHLNAYAPLYAGLAEAANEGPWTEERSRAIERARAISENRFTFLDQSVAFAGEPAWNDPTLSHLWRFNLHYFDYVRELLVWGAAEGMDAAYATFRALAKSWIETNQALQGDAWHSYTISLRLGNWLNAIVAFDSRLSQDESFRKQLIASVYGQAQILSSDLELDLRGNHLLENIRALISAGLAFGGAEAEGWFKRGQTLLEPELNEQVLSDGGHFERSPGYHLVVLKCCLETSLWMRRNGRIPPECLDAAVRRMLDYVIAILPDGQPMPLLKDTAWDGAPAPHDLLASGALYFNEPAYKRSESFGLYPVLLFGLLGWEKFRRWPRNDSPRLSAALTESGHYVMRDDARGDYLILDAGKPCPEYLPGHAHADLLSYELVIGNQRVIVDSGVYEYTAGPWRDYFRSTKAHNTVEVAGENQSEVWSSFRVGRRARVGRVTWRDTDDHVLLQAEHDGYKRLAVPVQHRRTVVWKRNQFWLVVDELFGFGQTSAANHLHFRPDLILEARDDATWRIMGGDAPLWLTAFGHRTHTIARGQTEPWRQGWYSEQFGQLEPNTVLSLHLQMSSPTCFGYVLSKQNLVQVRWSKTSEGYEINVASEEYCHSLALPTDSTPGFE